MSFASFALGDVSDDGRAAYVAWSSAVRQYGGVVTSFPSSVVGDNLYVPAGAPAARYPFDVIYPDGANLAPIFHSPPIAWSADSGYGYFAAPADVAAYVLAGGITAPVAVPGETAPHMPNWYDNLEMIVKAAPWVLGGAVALYLLSWLPRPRNG